MSFSNIQLSGFLITCEINHGIPRPVLPEAFRKSAFLRLRGLSHSGIRAGINSDVNKLSKECMDCQKNKISCHVHPPL